MLLEVFYMVNQQAESARMMASFGRISQKNELPTEDQDLSEEDNHLEEEL